MFMFKHLISVVVLGICSVAGAEWRLDNTQSRLNFISIKAGDLAEIHRFTKLSGRISDDGTVTILIELASVETLIPIRDERIRSLLFEVGKFPKAVIRSKVDTLPVQLLAPGSTINLPAKAILELHGTQHTVVLDLLVAKLDQSKVLIASAKPVVIDVRNVGLSDGIEQLRNIARLPSISRAVPIDFNLLFTR